MSGRSRGLRRPRLGLLIDSYELPIGQLGSVLADLSSLCSEVVPVLTSDRGWLHRLLGESLDAVLPICGPDRHGEVVAALSACAMPIVGGRDRLAAVGGDRAVLASVLAAQNLPVAPVYPSQDAPPLPLPVDVSSRRALAGSRWLRAASPDDLDELRRLFSALDETAWYSPAMEERWVVGTLFGDPIGIAAISTHDDGRTLSQLAEIPADLPAAESAELLLWARRAIGLLDLHAPAEVELGRLDGAVLIRSVRRNLALDPASPLGRLCAVQGLSRTEVWEALLERTLTARPEDAPAAAAEVTVH